MTKTIVTFLLDRTGSMAQVLDDTIGAFNTYIDTLKTDGEGIEFTFLQFDSVSLDKVHVGIPICDVPALTRKTYEPRAWTPLIDASVKTIKAVDEALAKRSDAPKVVVCIQTDGDENASTQYTWEDLNKLIKEKTEAGWQFNFMGAGLDAYKQGAKMGISASNTVSYDKNDSAATRASFRATAANTSMYASGAATDTAYSMSQKTAAGDKFVPPATKTKTKPQPPKTTSVVDDFAI